MAIPGDEEKGSTQNRGPNCEGGTDLGAWAPPNSLFEGKKAGRPVFGGFRFNSSKKGANI